MKRAKDICTGGIPDEGSPGYLSLNLGQSQIGEFGREVDSGATKLAEGPAA